jgi:AraC family transcriptional regulator
MNQTKPFHYSSGNTSLGANSKAVIPIGRAAVAVRMYSESEHCPCVGISGTAAATRQVPGFRIIENHYTGTLELPRHFHESAYLSYILEGQYSESYGGSGSVVCLAGAVRYLPPGHKHSNTFRAGTRCLLVEIEPSALQRVAKHTETLQQPGEIQSIAGGWLAQRLYQEFRQGDQLALMSLEGILLELLAEGARHAGGSGPVRMVPRWLRTAREYLESNFLRPLSLAEVAGVAGVHRVHLSREFRRHFATTVGEFLRAKRVEHACHLVSKTNEPLADVAMSCGFSDQSHFSATFRRQVGLTPGRFRQMAQAR